MTSRLGSGLIPAEVDALAGLENLEPFRFRPLDGKVLLTTEVGDWALASSDDFDRLLHGTLPDDAPLRATLQQKGFLKDSRSPEEIAARLARRKSYCASGPYLHVLITTLRCNQTCGYCHASREGFGATGCDMSIATAERAVEVAMESPAPAITFEFQGGEPLANFAVVRRVVEHALALRDRSRKTVGFSLVSNLSLMDDEKLAFILDQGIQVCTSLDGPADLHDANRPWPGHSSHAETVRWMERINQGYRDRQLDPDLYHVEALLTVTRASLSRARDIVDEYVRLGLKAMFVRALNPFGFAQKTWAHIGYSTDELLTFHREVLDHVLALNRQGTQLLERLASIFLVKILTGGDPNYLDIRSPCGAGLGQIAYNHDGQVFCCDEGRMMHQMGDPLFRMGALGTHGYADLIESDVVRAASLASCLEATPVCCDCAYLPYCGTCPVYNYATQRNLFPRIPDNDRCRLHLGVLDHLFGLLGAGDPALDAIFARWVEARERPFFAHDY